jgi:hypothetical protein
VTWAPQPGQEIPVEQVSGGVLARMRPDVSVGAALPPAGRRRPGGGSPGAWHIRVASTTMPGWLVMTAGPRCCGWPCRPFWTRPGPRGCSDGCARPPPLLPSPLSAPGTGPPGGGGPWPRGRALLATAWWHGAWARKRRPRPRCTRTCNRTSRGCCASLAPRPRLRPGRRHPRPAAYRGTPPFSGPRTPPLYRLACTVVGMVLGLWWGPRRLTVLAIAVEAPNAVIHVPWVARAVQRRKPRIATGWALVAAASVARLRAAAAEPLGNYEVAATAAYRRPSQAPNSSSIASAAS